jgi:hypothetical protein
MHHKYLVHNRLGGEAKLRCQSRCINRKLLRPREMLRKPPCSKFNGPDASPFLVDLRGEGQELHMPVSGKQSSQIGSQVRINGR